MVYIIALHYQKKFPKSNLHDSELKTYVHVHRRQLPKSLLHIPSYLRTIYDVKSDDCDDGVLKVTTMILKVTILTTALCGRTPRIIVIALGIKFLPHQSVFGSELQAIKGLTRLTHRSVPGKIYRLRYFARNRLIGS